MSVLHLTDSDFDKTLLAAKNRVLVDFWASWCTPCKMLTPILEQAELELQDYTVAKIEIDECPEIADRYGITTVPTLIVFSNGKELNRSVGVIPKQHIIDLVKA